MLILMMDKWGHDHEPSGFILITRKCGFIFKILEKLMRKSLFGSNALLRKVGQHFQQQVKKIDAIRDTTKVVFEVNPLETAEGIEETRIEGYSLLVLFLLLDGQ